MNKTRRLVIVLGDQLDMDLSALDDFLPARDIVWMAENSAEATHVWCHKKRLVYFFAAMRHHRDRLRHQGLTVSYHQLERLPAEDDGKDFTTLLGHAIDTFLPTELVMTECGDNRVAECLATAASNAGLTLNVRPDRHFYTSREEFATWANERKRLVLEDFYRAMRRRHDILIKDNGPSGGAWNFDQSNRESFGKDGPKHLPPLPQFEPDTVTREVIDMVATRFADHPGVLAGFALPVTREDAIRALNDFIAKRLPTFGPYQDALWTDMDFAYHSRLSAALNVHLLDPRECVNAAIAAYRNGDAPIASVEGFVRQILGWREFVRGIYWLYMPAYQEHNALNATLPVPDAYWTGQTDMVCVSQAIRNVRENAYAHHIQRLMVLGLFAQLLGVAPGAFNDWHMAMYVDAIDWVSLPNALGMSQFGDGGIVGTKPYCASGNYINKMSNYCRYCRYNYKQASGEQACPVTTLYWDFLDRHYNRFKENPRMRFQMNNIRRKRDDNAMIKPIRERAAWLKRAVQIGDRF